MTNPVDPPKLKRNASTYDHWISQFHLREFADPTISGGQTFWKANLATGAIETQTPRSFSGDFGYNDSTGSPLARADYEQSTYGVIENLVAQDLKRVKANGQLSPQMKEHWIEFAALQSVRTSRIRKQVEHHALIEARARAYRDMQADGTLLKSSVGELNQILENRVAAMVRDLPLMFSAEFSKQFLFPEFKRMHWRLVLDSEQALVLCDNGITFSDEVPRHGPCFVGPKGLVALVMSPGVAFLGAWNPMNDSFTAQYRDGLNRRTCEHSAAMVYCNSRSLAEKMVIEHSRG